MPEGTSERRQRPSVYDVARHAAVSIATVSRVLHGTAPVADETRGRVLAAADELRWRPSRLARAFVAQRHGAVGIVFPELSGPYYARVIAGFEDRAAEHRSAVLILATHGRENAGELVSDLADRVDGLVVMGRTVSDAVVTSIASHDVPIVLLARPPLGDLAGVRAENSAPADALAQHLLSHGRRQLVFVGDPTRSPDVGERWRGVRCALRRAGIDTSRALVPCDGFDVEHGYKAALDLFASGIAVDAVMCANDEVASGVLQAAAAHGLRVPEDIVITGWDDTPLAARAHPPLTTVRQPMHELGARAAALLFERIEGRPVTSVVLRASVVRRASCGCPPHHSTGLDHPKQRGKPMRRTSSIIASLALAGSAISVGSTQVGAGDAPGHQPATVPEGDITVWAMGAEGENLGILADQFMEEFPDVSVDVTAVPWDSAHDQIVTAIAGGEVPDVSLVGTTWMGEFATIGGLEPTPASIDPAQFFEGAWGTTVVDGVSYGVPWYVETRVVYYRTDLAEAGGFNQAPANWDELTQLAQATVDGGAKYGISLQPGGTGSWQTYMPFFWQAGGEIVDADNNFTLNSQACVDSLTYYDSFFESGLAQDTVSDVPVEAQFADGDVGAFISGPWMMAIVTDAGADPATWTVAHQPTETAGTSFVGGGDLAVFEQSDNKAAAWAFVEFLSRPDVQVTWYQTVNDLPAVQAAWDDETLAGDDLLATFGEQLQDAKSPPAIPTWEQVAAAIDGQVEAVTVGDTSPEDGCAAMQEEAESIGTGL